MKSGLFFDFFCVFFRKGGADGEKEADLRLFRGFFACRNPVCIRDQRGRFHALQITFDAAVHFRPRELVELFAARPRLKRVPGQELFERGLFRESA